MLFTKESRATLTNGFFAESASTAHRVAARRIEGVYEGRDRKSKELRWTGTRVDSSSAHIRCCAPSRGLRIRRLEAEVRAGFIAAWSKVMNLDRFDLLKCEQLSPESPP